MIESTIEMNDLRYLNLFLKITKISTRHCIKYNDTIIFAVPKPKLQKALGKDAENIQKMKRIIKKKVRIISLAKEDGNMKEFISQIIYPNEFNDLEIKDNEIIINAGRENKAALIGRNKRRLLELQTIAKNYYGMGLRIA